MSSFQNTVSLPASAPSPPSKINSLSSLICSWKTPTSWSSISHKTRTCRLWQISFAFCDLSHDSISRWWNIPDNIARSVISNLSLFPIMRLARSQVFFSHSKEIWELGDYITIISAAQNNSKIQHGDKAVVVFMTLAKWVRSSNWKAK